MTSTSPAIAAVPRVAALDVFRGLVMFLMLAEVMHLAGLARTHPGNAFFGFVAFHTSHVEWEGASLHDLIQPGFSFLVGAALPFSVASRRTKGQSFRRMLAHACWRAFLLIALGVFLRSIGKPRTNFTFEDTLSQIGMGYVLLFLLAFVPVRAQIAVLAAILIGYWALFALYPAPGPDFDYANVGVPPDWPHHYSGFLSHWNKNSNAAWAFDTWFLNLFPREQPFRYNAGGYATLSFIPTLGTMLLGLLAGQWIRSPRSNAKKLQGFVFAGVGLIAAAVGLQWAGACPIVKRIWTPAFTMYSGGLVVLILAGIFAITELKGWRGWAFPLIIIGANSIAAYVMSWTMEGFFSAAVSRHLGVSGPVLKGVLVLAILWSMLFWMYRRKIFLRI